MPHKSEVDNMLAAVHIIENEVSGFSRKLRSSSNFTGHVEEVN